MGRWFQPFVGTSHEDEWIDRSELSDAEVHKQAGDNLSEMVTLLCWLAIRPGPDKRGRVIRWHPTLRDAIRHDLMDDTAEVAVAAATVGKDPVSPGQLADDLLEAIDFLDDDLWCSRTAETLEIDSLRIESLAPDQWIQVALHVSGIDDGLLDSRVPTLIAAIRQYRNIDTVAIYSDDDGWRLGVTTGQSAWYREATTGVVHESLVLGPGAVRGSSDRVECSPPCRAISPRRLAGVSDGLPQRSLSPCFDPLLDLLANLAAAGGAGTARAARNCRCGRC
jgi:hypothetical protein